MRAWPEPRPDRRAARAATLAAAPPPPPPPPLPPTRRRLSHRSRREAVGNAKLRATLTEVIREAGAAGGCPKARGALLYSAATKFPANALAHRPRLLALVAADAVATNVQLEGACAYLAGVGAEACDQAALEAAAGVGVTVSPAEVAAGVAAVVAAAEPRLREQRYRLNPSILLGAARADAPLKWADVGAVRAELEAQIAALLGPKTEADLAPPPPKKKAPKAAPAPAPAAVAAAAADAAADAPDAPPADPWAFLPPPEANNGVHTTVTFSTGEVLRPANTREQLEAHLAATGGRVVTRFPPEPNGYLHLGHAKAMFVDFGMAAARGGECLLRFDDTNPEAEKREYIDHILEIVRWLGWAPARVTHSSDYFPQLHALAVELIKRGHAYVCHQSGEEIKAAREARAPSPWRDRPPAESLALFAAMRRGAVDEGAATLRMRQDHRNENFNMFDLVAYRVKFAAHPEAGDAWCIYPSYDFTHCLVDSLEQVTHSMCTLEFETRRASYFWLLEVLRLYKPVVWEYSRLNVTHNVMSKRKLNRLVTDGHVSGWDDPRLLTLAGLRRRGVAPAAINAFCRELGVTRAEGEVHPHRLEHHVRGELDARAPRALGVLRPLRVRLTNLPAAHAEAVAARAFPGRTDETYPVPFSAVVFIEETDFREADERGYFGLAPGKAAMLRYAYPITATGFTRDAATGRVDEVQATVDLKYVAAGRKPPKGVLNWVAAPAAGPPPPTFEARLYAPLFRSASPPEDWLSDIDPASLTVLRGCLATARLAAAAVGDVFQLERLGYFCVDPDSRPGALVLNRTVELKQTAAAAAGAAGRGGK